MRLVATEYLSLDGVFEEPGTWSIPFFNEQAARFKERELHAADARLLGRRTYEGFAAAWPKMRDETGDFGAKMNTMAKYVITSTIERPESACAVAVNGDAVREVRKLKAKPGNDLLLAGSAQLFNALMRADLIDLYRFMVHPIVLGAGARLFSDEAERPALRLAHHEAFETGIVILEYVPSRPAVGAGAAERHTT